MPILSILLKIINYYNIRPTVKDNEMNLKRKFGNLLFEARVWLYYAALLLVANIGTLGKKPF